MCPINPDPAMIEGLVRRSPWLEALLNRGVVSFDLLRWSARSPLEGFAVPLSRLFLAIVLLFTPASADGSEQAPRLQRLLKCGWVVRNQLPVVMNAHETRRLPGFERLLPAGDPHAARRTGRATSPWHRGRSPVGGSGPEASVQPQPARARLLAAGHSEGCRAAKEPHSRHLTRRPRSWLRARALPLARSSESNSWMRPTGLDPTHSGFGRARLQLAANGAGGGRHSPTGRDWRRVSIRLIGGSGELRGGDVNEGVALWSRGFEAQLRNEVVGLVPGGSGEVAALRRGPRFEVDVIVPLTPRVALVGGVGLMEDSSEGVIEHAVVYGEYRGMIRHATALRVRAVPMRWGAQYAFRVGRRVSFAVEGGAGLYFTHLSWSHHLDVEGRISGWVSETRGYDLGLHSAVWVDVGLFGRTGLVFGVEAVHANISGLVGFREGTFNYRSSIRDEGTLKLVGTPYDPDIFLVVGEGSWLNERYGPISRGKDASVGLSGLRFSAGLRIGL